MNCCTELNGILCHMSECHKGATDCDGNVNIVTLTATGLQDLKGRL